MWPLAASVHGTIIIIIHRCMDSLIANTTRIWLIVPLHNPINIQAVVKLVEDYFFVDGQ